MGCQRIPQTTTDLEPISSPSSARSARTDSRDGSCRASARSCLRHMRARWDRSTSTMPPSASAANTLEPAGLRSCSTWRRSSRFSSSSSRMRVIPARLMPSSWLSCCACARRRCRAANSVARHLPYVAVRPSQGDHTGAASADARWRARRPHRPRRRAARYRNRLRRHRPGRPGRPRSPWRTFHTAA